MKCINTLGGWVNAFVIQVCVCATDDNCTAPNIAYVRANLIMQPRNRFIHLHVLITPAALASLHAWRNRKSCGRATPRLSMRAEDGAAAGGADGRVFANPSEGQWRSGWCEGPGQGDAVILISQKDTLHPWKELYLCICWNELRIFTLHVYLPIWESRKALDGAGACFRVLHGVLSLMLHEKRWIELSRLNILWYSIFRLSVSRQ